MMRFMGSTAGILVEMVAFNATAAPVTIGLAAIGMAMSAIIWWYHFNRFIDGIIGLDLRGPDAPQSHQPTR